MEEPGTLERLRREQLELTRLSDAVRSDMVVTDRGSRESNRDDIVLRLDNGDKLNYCVLLVLKKPIFSIEIKFSHHLAHLGHLGFLYSKTVRVTVQNSVRVKFAL